MNLTLEGVKVIDLSSAMAGPSAAKLMAQWGADVIHVEPPSGDMARGPQSAFDWFNTNKLGLVVDLKKPEGMEILYKLLDDADILLTNYRTNALEKLGLKYETLKDRYPSLVYGHLTGFGNKGPDVDRPGFDTTAFLARAGFGIDFSENAEVPTIIYQGIGDLATGITFAAGLLAALYKKKTTGKGEKVSVSLYGTGVYLQMLQFADIQRGISFPRSRLAPKMAVANTYRTKDGEWFVLSAFAALRYVPAILRFLGKEEIMNGPGWDSDVGIHGKNDILVPIFDEGFGRYTIDEITQFFEQNDVPYEKLCHIKDIIQDKQALANEFFIRQVDVYGRDEVLPATPVKFGDNSPGRTENGPRLGQHTAMILKRLGYSAEEIAKLKEQKCIIAE